MITENCHKNLVVRLLTKIRFKVISRNKIQFIELGLRLIYTDWNSLLNMSGNEEFNKEVRPTFAALNCIKLKMGLNYKKILKVLPNDIQIITTTEFHSIPKERMNILDNIDELFRLTKPTDYPIPAGELINIDIWEYVRFDEDDDFMTYELATNFYSVNLDWSVLEIKNEKDLYFMPDEIFVYSLSDALKLANLIATEFNLNYR